MGKIKYLMRSLRSRLSPKSKASGSPQTATSISSPMSNMTDKRRYSSTPTLTDASSNVQTPPSTPSKSPCAYKQSSVGKLAYSQSCALPEVSAHEPQLGAHATLEVNVAILDFAKRLPLEELSLVGGSSVLPLPPSADTSTPWRREMAAAMKSAADKPFTPDRAPRYSSESSDSSLSFVCSSAVVCEQERRQRDDVASVAANPLPRQVGDRMCGTFHQGFPNEPPNLLEPNHNENVGQGYMSEAEFAALPAWSDMETNSEYDNLGDDSLDVISAVGNGPLDHRCTTGSPPPDVSYISFTNFGPMSCATSSIDSCDAFLRSLDLADMEIRHPMMSDDDFAALPDWSEVEDNSAYNEPFVKASYCWSSTASSVSWEVLERGDVIIEPTVYVPTGYPFAGIKRKHSRSSQSGNLVKKKRESNSRKEWVVEV